MSDIKLFVEHIVKHLVDIPEEIDVSEHEGEGTTVYGLRVAKSDIGKVIGKRGQTINSIRTLLGAISAKAHRRSILELIEEEK